MIVNYVHLMDPTKVLFFHSVNENGGVPRIGETIQFGLGPQVFKVEGVERRFALQVIVVTLSLVG